MSHLLFSGFAYRPKTRMPDALLPQPANTFNIIIMSRLNSFLEPMQQTSVSPFEPPSLAVSLSSSTTESAPSEMDFGPTPVLQPQPGTDSSNDTLPSELMQVFLDMLKERFPRERLKITEFDQRDGGSRWTSFDCSVTVLSETDLRLLATTASSPDSGTSRAADGPYFHGILIVNAPGDVSLASLLRSLWSILRPSGVLVISSSSPPTTETVFDMIDLSRRVGFDCPGDLQQRNVEGWGGILLTKEIV
jgi:hypothetical protein